VTTHAALDLLRMQIDALYLHDVDGRLTGINEPDSDEAVPRFFLGRTALGNLWRIGASVPADLAAALERLAADEPPLSDRQPPRHHAEYTELLRQQNAEIEVYSGPAYILPDLDPSASAVTITAHNASVLEANYPYTLSVLEARTPVAAILVDGAAVAACYSARNTEHAAEAGVHTGEAYRGRGYAEEVVRAWAAAVRASGRVPLYSTSWDNIASQRVAAKLGAVQYAEDFSIT
jgi:RimJ/RimL family protein N-acetyltransferase